MIETLHDFVEKMNELGIEYMVTGSYAMSTYGEIRMTRDIDIVIQLSDENIDSFFLQFKETYYISDESLRNAVDRKSMFNIVSHAHGGKIDCIMYKNDDFARTSFARRFKVTVADVEFWTSTREDLVIAKLNWAKDSLSEMQIRDIANLTNTEYDSTYVEGWIKRLDLTDIWAEVGQWKIRHTRPDN